MNDSQEDVLSSIYEKVQNSEKLLELLLANELIDSLECQCVSKENDVDVYDSVVISKEVKRVLKKHKLKLGKRECFNEKKYQYIIMKTGVRIRDIVDVCNVFYEYQNEMIPVFQYERINGNQKKALLKDRISFYIEEKEIHLFEE